MSGAFVICVVSVSAIRSITGVFMLASILLSGLLLQQEIQTPELPQKELHSPGHIAVVMEGGKVIFQEVVGSRRANAESPLLIDDPMHLASISKSLGGYQIALAVRDGKIDLDRPVASYFPDVEVHSGLKELTVRHLVHHASGLPDYDGSLAFRSFVKGDLRRQRESIVEHVLTREPDEAPGSTFRYANVNYILLGALLEKVYDKPWEQLVRDQVFIPFGLKTAGFGATGKMDDANLPTAPYQHLVVDGKSYPVTLDNPAYFGPSGSVHMSVPDLARWASFHLEGSTTGLRNAPKGVPGDTAFWKGLLTTRKESDYGFGWVVNKDRDGKITFGHSGSNLVSGATVLIIPEQSRVAVVMANVAPDLMYADRILAGILLDMTDESVSAIGD